MDFVVFVLEYVFNRTEPEAFSIMLKVHTEGLGIAGVYPYEVAKMKSEKAMNLAKAREYPLLMHRRGRVMQTSYGKVKHRNYAEAIAHYQRQFSGLCSGKI